MVQVNNLQAHWCEKIIHHLVENDIEHFFIAPGSRSTPLTSSVARNSKAKSFVVLDERSLGFMALSWAKAQKKIAAILTTSGTAVGNLLPSIMEACHSQVALLILTADRPYELLDSNANQTTNQDKIFASFVKKSFNIPPPTDNIPLPMVKRIFSLGINCAVSKTCGPVHFNLQFREPLVASLPEKKLHISSYEGTFTQKAFIKAEDFPKNILDTRSLIVVGEASKNCALAAQKLAMRLGCPLFADILSGLKFHGFSNVIENYDLCLVKKSFNETCDFSSIIFVGSRLVSKRFWQWAETLSDKTKFFHVDEREENIDQIGRFSKVSCQNVEGFLDELAKEIPQNEEGKNLTAIKALSRYISDYTQTFFMEKNHNEAFYCWELLKFLPAKTNVFLSSSMPIRYFEMFAFVKKTKICFHANRGLSGIDGVISSFIGMSLALPNEHSVLVIGDLAFLHDVGALVSLSNLKKPVLIILLNNSGGGIFQLLPINDEKDVFEKYFQTPQKANIKNLCDGYNIHHTYACVDSFANIIEGFFKAPQHMVVEITSNQEQNGKKLKEFFAILCSFN